MNPAGEEADELASVVAVRQLDQQPPPTTDQ